MYFSNDIFIVFLIAVANMDHNGDSLRVIGHLRDISVAWRGVDEILLTQTQSTKLVDKGSHSVETQPL